MANADAAEVEQLLRIEVSDRQWRRFVEAYAPIKADASPRSVTMAGKKRHDLTRLWTRDHRVQPWAGTAYGVVQAVNTYVHHLGTVRGANRIERNMIRAVTCSSAYEPDRPSSGTSTTAQYAPPQTNPTGSPAQPA